MEKELKSVIVYSERQKYYDMIVYNERQKEFGIDSRLMRKSECEIWRCTRVDPGKNIDIKKKENCKRNCNPWILVRNQRLKCSKIASLQTSIFCF